MIIAPATVEDLSEIVVLDADAAKPWSEESWRSQLELGSALTLVARGPSQDTRLRRAPTRLRVRPSRLSGVEERSNEHTRLSVEERSDEHSAERGEEFNTASAEPAERFSPQTDDPYRLVNTAQSARREQPRGRSPQSVLGMAAFRLAGDVADLLRVAVRREARRCGIGHALVGAGIDWAASVAAQRVLLEVELNNAPALALYRKLGFTELSVRHGYFGPESDALVMEKDLTLVDEQLAGGVW